ncbi:RING-5 like protein [Beauveria brongniartii RCEF 3172]|uniref:RING-5 like protein n=1 Tax=Beauveria brongniartii RCEF 3172 TaxID=1081107 RepID=A0A167CH84_9HYPO|nr:RING-5 like protein [Beauveria brongniartii RCEF 3172]
MDSDEDFMSQLSSDDEIMPDSADDLSDADFDDEDFDEPDPDFGLSPKELGRKKTQAHVVPFRVYEPTDIQKQQDEMISEVNMILDMGKEDAAIMLRHFRWNKERLLEDYMDRPEKVLEAAGLNSNTNNLPKLEAVPGFSARLDKDIAIKTEKKMVQLQTTSGMSWIEVQYLNAASQALQTCRQTLKWTYAFAFYLAKTNLTEIFEDNQKDLEMAVENLSEMFEKPIQELSDSKLKVDIMDKTSYCNKRRIILLEDTADNLAKGKWTFNSELTAPASVLAAPPARQ